MLRPVRLSLVISFTSGSSWATRSIRSVMSSSMRSGLAPGKEDTTVATRIVNGGMALRLRLL